MLSEKFDHPGGFNMLSIEDWSGIAKRLELKGIKEGTKAFDDYIWETYNKPWLESALQRGDDIILWSDPYSNNNLQKYYSIDKIFDYSYFGRELEFL